MVSALLTPGQSGTAQVHLERVNLDRLPVAAVFWTMPAAQIRWWLAELDVTRQGLAGRVGTECRGAAVRAHHDYLVGFTGWHVCLGVAIVEVFDRWAVLAPDGSHTVLDARPTAAAGVVIDPAWRGRRIGAAVLEMIPAHPELADVEVFVMAREASNQAAARAATRAGWAQVTEEADGEGMVWHRFERRDEP